MTAPTKASARDLSRAHLSDPLLTFERFEGVLRVFRYAHESLGVGLGPPKDAAKLCAESEDHGESDDGEGEWPGDGPEEVLRAVHLADVARVHS